MIIRSSTQDPSIAASVQAQSNRQGADDARRRLLAAMPVTERRLRLAGVSTAVFEGGAGPPVVLLHGPGGFAAHWMRVIPELVTHHRVIVPELPGHGGSIVDDVPLTVARVRAWLSELISETRASRPALVGHLLGGAIAARFAASDGTRLDRVVLVDTFGLTPFEPAPRLARALTEFLAQPTEHTHEMLWQYCARDLGRLRKEMGERWVPFEAYNLDRARTPSVRAAFSALMSSFGVAIPPVELARIAVPATLIWGRHDLATPLDVAAAASTRYGWPLHVIENANDAPPIEQPEAFLGALRMALGSSTEVVR